MTFFSRLLITVAFFFVFSQQAQAATSFKTVSFGLSDSSLNVFFNQSKYKALRPSLWRTNIEWDISFSPVNTEKRQRLIDTCSAAWSSKQRPIIALWFSRGANHQVVMPQSNNYGFSSDVAAYRAGLRGILTDCAGPNGSVPDIQTWNEADLGQKTIGLSPTRGARYYAAAKDECPQCVISAYSLSIASLTNTRKWIVAFNKAIRHYHKAVKVVALHPYVDVNSSTHPDQLASLKKQIGSARVWLTEVSAYYARQGRCKRSDSKVAYAVKSQYGRSPASVWCYKKNPDGGYYNGNAAKQAHYTKRLISKSNTWIRKMHVDRILWYGWQDITCSASSTSPLFNGGCAAHNSFSWDSSLLNRNGQTRSAYSVLRAAR